jgi:hypothetical protein
MRCPKFRTMFENYKRAFTIADAIMHGSQELSGLNVVIVDVPANNLTATSIRLAFALLVGVVIVVVCRVHWVK